MIITQSRIICRLSRFSSTSLVSVNRIMTNVLIPSSEIYRTYNFYVRFQILQQIPVGRTVTLQCRICPWDFLFHRQINCDVTILCRIWSSKNEFKIKNLLMYIFVTKQTLDLTDHQVRRRRRTNRDHLRTAMNFRKDGRPNQIWKIYVTYRNKLSSFVSPSSEEISDRFPENMSCRIIFNLQRLFWWSRKSFKSFRFINKSFS